LITKAITISKNNKFDTLYTAMKYFSFAILTLIVTHLFAQVPTPAKPQATPIVLKGATIHVGNGMVIENGAVVFDKGIITFAGKQTDLKLAGNETIMDVTGKHVYPGLIAANTILGLVEVEAARPTRDFREVGEMNPNIRSLIAYNTDSKIIPTIRSNGILLAEVVPQGNTMAGASSVVQLDAWNWEDAAYKTDMGIHLNWPVMHIKKGWWAQPEPSEQNKKYLEGIKTIEDFFEQARAYSKAENVTEKNLKMEAMKEVFLKKKKVFVYAHGAKEILNVAAFKKKFDINVVLVGGEESYMVADVLKENNIAVVLNDIHALPGKPEDDVDLPFKLPYLLKEKGVDFCITIAGSWQVRNLPFVAGTTVAYGLSKEEALSSITYSAAKILGIDNKTGTIAAGKDANIIVSTGDVLDMKSSIIEHAFIQGRAIELQNHQNHLYQKFTDKYAKP
jgi:imidazolonepropionase-like amidohydrolase